MTSTNTLTGPRQLQKSFEPLICAYDSLQARWDVDAQYSNSWRNAGPFTLYQETYFDTSGYTRDMLTTMPINAFVQECGRNQIAFGESMRILKVDLIMTDRIDDVTQFASALAGANVMEGFPNSTMDWTQIQFGTFQELIGVTQGTATQDVFSVVTSQSFGSLEPTTADKLWIYKFVITLGLPSAEFATLRIPSSRTILQVDIVEESEMPFLMRQKRSFELKQ